MTAPDVEVGPMPWHVEYGHADCDDNEWAVVADATGEVAGCHATRGDAEQQIQALYAQEPQANALVASGEPHTGAMVAWVPSMVDAERLAMPPGEMAPELHCTAIYLGEADQFSPEQQTAIIAAVSKVASAVERFAANAFGIGVFNPLGEEPCGVLLVGGPELAAAQAALLADPALASAAAADAHTPWIPHVTLGYLAPGEPVTIGPDLQARTGGLTFDRLRVAFAGVTTDIPLQMPPPPEPIAYENDPDMVAAAAIAPEGTPFEIPVAVREGVWSSSGRMFAPDSLTVAQLPISLKVQLADNEGHRGALIAGRIDEMVRVPGDETAFTAKGVMDDAGEAGAEALRLARQQMLNGVSVTATDIDDADVELIWPVDGESDDMEPTDDATLIDDGEGEGGEDFHLPGQHNQKSHGRRPNKHLRHLRPSRHSADFAAVEEDDDSEDFHLPGQHNQKSHGRRPNKHLRHLRPSRHSADFAADGEDGMMVGSPREIYHAGRIRSLTIVAEPDFEECRIVIPDAAIEAAEPAVVVASGAVAEDGSYTITIPRLWPESWFAEPDLDEMPPFGAIHITASGRITGWLAPPGVTHRAFRAMGRDIYVPRGVDYSEFNNKPALVASAEGRPVTINAGTLTFDCGHASPIDPRRVNPSWAAEHYENSCSVAARVRIAEHSHNGAPYVAGGLLHGIDAATIERMMGCALSGDWQNKKLKAALFVPVEGFPTKVSASMRVQHDHLVASSVPVAFERTAAQMFDDLARTIGMDADSRFRDLERMVEG